MKIPEAVKEAWGRKEGAVILATVDVTGGPNIIYVTCVSLYGDDRLVVPDNYFDKTRKNIKAGSNGFCHSRLPASDATHAGSKLLPFFCRERTLE